MKYIAAVVLFAATCLAQSQPAQSPTEFNTFMMQTTFRITGQAGAGQSVGTAFLVGRPIPLQPDKQRYVLVTAAHVLNALTGDTAILLLRQKDGQGKWHEFGYPLPIRSQGQPTWVRHPIADVAAMYVSLPTSDFPLIPAGLMATDANLTQFGVHPGDDLNVLGYPLGLVGPGGFPILRSGKIASYPLVPAKDNPFFYLDFRVFKGNSGGPVYLVSLNRQYGGTTYIGSVRMLMGLVSEEMSATEDIRAMYETRSQVYPLSIAKIVPAVFIQETVEMLPAPVPIPAPPVIPPPKAR